MTRRSAMLLAVVSPALARAYQETDGKSRPSPHDTVSVNLAGQKMTISYGRPYLKGRHLGNAMAPYDKVWRLGADEATKITVPAAVLIAGGPKLSSGSYALFAELHPDHWTMIINKVADQWGAFQYEESQDLGRFDLKVKPLPNPVEQFTIGLEKQGDKSARVNFSWDKAAVSTVLTLA